MNFLWDTRRQARLTLSRNGLEIRRGCLVSGIPVVEGETGTDPEVLIKVLADVQCPVVGISTYPSAVPPFNYAILDQVTPTNDPTMTASQARLEFVYRVNHTPQPWTVTDGGQGSYVECNGTAEGTRAITVFYKKNQSPLIDSPPPSEPGNQTFQQSVRGVHKFYPQRTLRVVAHLLAADWNSVKLAVRAAAGSINATQWGPDGNDARGTWLFLFPVSTTSDWGRTYQVEVNFLYDPRGHFPVGLYHDRFGDIPPDAYNLDDLDVDLGGPPAYDHIQQLSGIVRASVYHENEFNTLFTFNPSM